MRYKTKTKDCYLIVTAKASFGELIDEQALDAFGRIYLRGFLKPRLVKKNKVEYSGPVGISLYERLKSPITKREFLFILEQVMVAWQKMQTNGLAVQKLVLDIHYVYINEVTKEVQFLYVPTISKSDDGPRVTEEIAVTEFVESIIYSVIPAEEKDKEFVSAFVYFLKGLKSFDAETVERYIAKEDRSVVNTIKKQNAGQSGFMTSKRKHYYDHYDGKPTDPADEVTGLLEEDNTALLDDGGMYRPGDRFDGEETGLLMSEDETSLLVQEDAGQFPHLLRVATDEQVTICKPVFRLGKESGYVDFPIMDNPAVSRSHADIVTRGGRYFIVDLNSKNHTYINEEMIPAQFETELHDGDKIRLANEEFVFVR